MDKKRVLVTGIGGNVGQGILRNILATDFDIVLYGCNTVELSAGNHFCEKVFHVPFAYDKDYISTINKIITENKIDLVIPSTDYEVHYLSKHSSEVKCTVAVSGPLASEIYLDKYKTFLHHQKFDIPFALSFLPSEYKGGLKEIIAKPKEGRGSRGIVINPMDISVFNDEQYMIQELHRGKEITTAFYVDKQGQLHGHITMERSLDNGATSQCKVVKEFDKELDVILKKIISNADIKGSANLQSIVNAEGKIVPFEVNCRISGTNSIRSNFGFKDVLYTLQEYLYNTKPDKPVVTQGQAIRILMDIIYPEMSNAENTNSNSYIF